MGLRQVGRGASLPANPCSFVAGHHVSRVGWGAGKLGVVLRSPLTLVPSSRGTTSLGSDGLTARRGRMGVPACWGLRPPRDSTPCPRHWFGLFGLRPMGEAVAGLDSLQPGGGGETELDEPSAGGECGAPPEWWSLRLSGRGASLPANPCSFVAGHHVFGVGWASGKLSVVLHSPRTLVPSSCGTTTLGADGPPAS